MPSKEIRKQEIAKKLKNFRIEAGLTQLQVAEKLGITFQAVSNYERGKNSIEIDMLLKMCSIYNADPVSVLNVDVKGEIYNILYSDDSSLSEKIAAALSLFRIYFSRSTGYSFNSSGHPDFNSYVAMLLNQNQFKDRLGENVYAALIQEYGKKPGIPEGQTTYQIEKAIKSKNSSKTSKSSSFALSKSEQAHIKKYRSLDDFGKEAVDSILDIEHRRAEAAKGHAKAETPPEPERGKVIPLYYTPAAAGYASPAFGEDYEDYEVPVNSHADFAARIQGDSMEPWIADGSVVLVKRGSVEIGDVGLFFVDGDMKCKQYCKDNFGNVYLFSLNRKRADADVTIFASSGITLCCFGRVLLERRPPLPMA